MRSTVVEFSYFGDSNLSVLLGQFPPVVNLRDRS